MGDILDLAQVDHSSVDKVMEANMIPMVTQIPIIPSTIIPSTNTTNLMNTEATKNPTIQNLTIHNLMNLTIHNLTNLTIHNRLKMKTRMVQNDLMYCKNICDILQ